MKGLPFARFPPPPAAAGLLPAILLSLGPPLFLLGPALPSLFLNLSRKLASAGRLARLFVMSAELALVVSLLSLILGTAYALWLLRQGRVMKGLGWFLLPLPILLPKYLLGIAWWRIFDSSGVLGRFLLSLGLGTSALSHLGAPVVLSFAYFPIVAIIVLLDFEAISTPILEAAALQSHGNRIWTRGIIPGLSSPLLSAGAFLFCIALTDYSVPALFQLPVYSTELYSEFSFSGDTSMVSFLALPLILIGLACIPIVARGMRVSPKREGAPGGATALLPQQPKWLLLFSSIPATVAFLIPIGTPILLASGAGSFGVLIETLHGALPEIVTSANIAASAALISILCSLPVAGFLLKHPSKTLLALCLLPAVMPAPLYALGLLKSGALSRTGFALILALAGRFLPFALVTLLLVLRLLDPLLLEATDLAPPGLIFRKLRVKLFLVLPALLAAGSVVFSLSLGDVGASVLLAQPGVRIFSVKLFNLLHYGAGDEAAGLALGLLPIVYVIWGGAALFVRRIRKC